jgi:hypothetical protein
LCRINCCVARDISHISIYIARHLLREFPISLNLIAVHIYHYNHCAVVRLLKMICTVPNVLFNSDIRIWSNLLWVKWFEVDYFCDPSRWSFITISLWW